MTNYEKIKELSVEEMAEFLNLTLGCCELCSFFSMDTPCKSCVDGFRKWLETEANVP